MPRSCSSSDMAGTAMLYPPGTDGAAVTDVRLPGSRSAQHPESRNTRTSAGTGVSCGSSCSGSALAADAAPHGGRCAVEVECRVSVPVLDGHDARVDQGESGEEPGHLLAGTEGYLLAHRLGQRFFRFCRYIDLVAGRVGDGQE